MQNSFKNIENYSVCLGDFHMNKSRNYFEIRVESIDFKENLLIGLANQDILLNKNVLETGKFWGIQPFL